MRKILFLISFCLFMIVPVSAQDVFLPEDLPAPFYTENLDALLEARSHQFAWLDNETLVFAPFNQTNTPSQDALMAYQYNIATNELAELEFSPFYANFDETYRDYYQVAEGEPVVQSPYPFPDGSLWRGIFYKSSLSIDCGVNCDSSLVMGGGYYTTGAPVPTEIFSYRPLDITAGEQPFSVLWGRNLTHAVMQIKPDNQTNQVRYITLGSYNDQAILQDMIFPEDRLLTISDDGQRIAAVHFVSEGDIALGRQHLVIWEAPQYDESCACTYDATQQIIPPINPEIDRTQRFAGATFAGADTVLYIGELGLMRHNLLTNTSTPISREYNTGWIYLAIFSPDSTHAALVTDDGLVIVRLF